MEDFSEEPITLDIGQLDGLPGSQNSGSQVGEPGAEQFVHKKAELLTHCAEFIEDGWTLSSNEFLLRISKQFRR